MLNRLLLLLLLSVSTSVHAFLGYFVKDTVNRYVYVSLKVPNHMVPLDADDRPSWNEDIEMQLFSKANLQLQKNCENVFKGEYLHDIFDNKQISIHEKKGHTVYTYFARGHCKEPFNNPHGNKLAPGQKPEEIGKTNEVAQDVSKKAQEYFDESVDLWLEEQKELKEETPAEEY